jgi:nitrogen fixation/metabolism regulation signal transduction histidine kinase
MPEGAVAVAAPEGAPAARDPGPGVTRVAAVLLGLGAEWAGSVFRQLDAPELRLVAMGAKALRKQPPGAVPDALRACVEAMESFGGDTLASDRLLREAAVKALGAEGARAFDGTEPPPPPDEALGHVAQAEPEALAMVLSHEQPQTVALVLSSIDPSRAAAVVEKIPEALRADIQRSYVRAFAALLVAWALAAGALGAVLARRTTRRLADLLRAVSDLARGDLSVQVDPGRARDEVASLARAFNRMVREVRESRDRLVYLEKISGWQEVARRLAHEIKNPLTPIQLAFQQLEAAWARRAPQDADFARLLADAGDIVREEVGTLQRLVQEFSEFAKLPEARTEPAELGAFVEEFVRTSPQLAAAADLLVARGGECPVTLDKALMRRVLVNLVRNAVEAAGAERARVHLGVARMSDRAVLTVADEGPGIPEELRARIFDPYFTTRHEGTGLGLAIVKKIVLQHGGEIVAGAHPGGGASFTIALPFAPAPAADVS